jgi:carbamoyl-phosphate synthase small subunit
MTQSCTLALSDGTVFEGGLIGAPITASGELVFTTGMVGYSEAITDPSYFGQILCFTYPLIGNYGIPPLPDPPTFPLPSGFESSRPQAAAIIITVDSPETFHWNSFQSIDSWLKQYKVPGIIGLDTRHLVHLIRSSRNLLGRVEPQDAEGVRYLERGIDISGSVFYDPGMDEIIDHVSTKERMILGKGRYRVALIDCGVKWNIVRQLVEMGCEVELLPWQTDLSTVDCTGWLISNGPGDPTRTGQLKKQINELLKCERPILGICLGHQLLSLAAGATTRRMPYGHRSHNQPVYEVGTRKGHITTQNHGYVVEEASLPEEWQPWFKNVNDQTIEGIKHCSKPFASVQFHPEASGGPRDSAWVLRKFVEEVKSYATT